MEQVGLGIEEWKRADAVKHPVISLVIVPPRGDTIGGGNNDFTPWTSVMAAVLNQRAIRRSSWGTIVPADGRLQRRYRIWAADWEAYQFLVNLAQHRTDLEQAHLVGAGWLIPFRSDFRRTFEQRPCAGILRFLLDTDSTDSVYLVAIWLLGRTATRCCNYELDRLPEDGSLQGRHHLAKSLRRVEAWSRLRELSGDYPEDVFVRKMLERPRHDPFARRLDRFAQHVDRSHESEAATASRMPLWFRDSEWFTTPPKDTGWIRMLLERIKRWVRGE